MLTFRQFLIALGVAAALAATAGTASAVGHPCNGPYCNQAAYPKHRHTLLGFGHGHNNRCRSTRPRRGTCTGHTTPTSSPPPP